MDITRKASFRWAAAVAALVGLCVVVFVLTRPAVARRVPPAAPAVTRASGGGDTCGRSLRYSFDGALTLTLGGASFPLGGPPAFGGTFVADELASDAAERLIRFSHTYRYRDASGHASGPELRSIIHTRIDRRGRIEALLGRPGEAHQGVTVGLLLATQKVEPEAGEASYVATELDSMGDIRASYVRTANGRMKRRQRGDEIETSLWWLRGTGGVVTSIDGREIVTRPLSPGGEASWRADLIYHQRLAGGETTAADALCGQSVAEAVSALHLQPVDLAAPRVEVQARPLSSPEALDAALEAVLHRADSKDLSEVTPRLVDSLRSDPSAVGKVRHLLLDPSRDERSMRRLAGALAAAGTPPAQEALRAFIEAQRQSPKALAIGIVQTQLVRHPTAETVSLVDGLSRDGALARPLRDAALLAYGSLLTGTADPDVQAAGVARLERAILNESDPSAAGVAIAALANVKTPRGGEILAAAVTGEDKTIAVLAARQLNIAPYEGVAAVASQLGQLDDEVAPAALAALGSRPAHEKAITRQVMAATRAWLDADQAGSPRRMAALRFLGQAAARDAEVAPFLQELGSSGRLSPEEARILRDSDRTGPGVPCALAVPLPGPGSGGGERGKS